MKVDNTVKQTERTENRQTSLQECFSVKRQLTIKSQQTAAKIAPEQRTEHKRRIKRSLGDKMSMKL